MRSNSLRYIILKVLFLFIFIFSLFSCNTLKNEEDNDDSSQQLNIFVGAASKPPTEEIIKLFEQRTGIKVNVNFGGSGYILSQMKLTKTGDIFFPGSSDFMNKAKADGLIFSESERIPVYLVSAINVQKGNPKNIKILNDLLKPGIRIAIASPENVCVGTYAVEIIENNFSDFEKEMLKKNIVNYTESCDKTAAVLALKSVDAVIGWEVFQHWNPSKIETINLAKSEIVRVGYIPIAISTFTKNKAISKQFIDFVMSKEAQKIFEKHHYFTSVQQAFNYIGEEKPVGGIYQLPSSWIIK